MLNKEEINELTVSDLMRMFDINEEVISDMRDKYRGQKAHCSPMYSNRKLDANGDPVEFLVTFMEWAYIWQESGHWHERGCKKGDYCTMRKDDIGQYEFGNFTIGLHGENVSDAQKNRKRTDEQKEARKGAKNPNADHTIHHFINKKSGETFTGTRIELMEAHPELKRNKGNLSLMINPNSKIKTCCGWMIDTDK